MKNIPIALNVCKVDYIIDSVYQRQYHYSQKSKDEHEDIIIR